MRIGITMRTARETAYREVRDALDRSWWMFLEAALPDDIVVPLPNATRTATGIFHGLELDGLILTGGEDLGSSAERDSTETALVDLCLSRSLPVLGVCRGLQFLAKHLDGADPEACDASLHVATRHMVEIDDANAPVPGAPRRETNSFHRWAPRIDALSGLRIWARSSDGAIEGVLDRARKSLAIGWHPEREPVPDGFDMALFRNHFHGGRP